MNYVVMLLLLMVMCSVGYVFVIWFGNVGIWLFSLVFSNCMCLVCWYSSVFDVVVMYGCLCLMSMLLICFFSSFMCCDIVDGVIFSFLVVCLNELCWIMVVRVLSNV